MGVLQSLVVAGLVGALLYGADRGIAYHVCLYSAIASGSKFEPEDAFREMDNPFFRIPRILLLIAVLLLAFLLSRRDGIKGPMEIGAIVVVIFAYVGFSLSTAFSAFRETRFGKLR